MAIFTKDGYICRCHCIHVALIVVFVQEECFDSSYNYWWRYLLFGMLAPQELGMILTIGMPFGGLNDLLFQRRVQPTTTGTTSECMLVGQVHVKHRHLPFFKKPCQHMVNSLYIDSTNKECQSQNPCTSQPLC